MSENPTAAYAIIAMGIFAFINFNPADSTEYLEIKCSPRASLDKDRKCEGSDISPGARIRILVNQYSNTVIMKVIENNSQYFGDWFILDDCRVVSSSDWKCGHSSINEKITSDYGVSNKQYFHSTTGGGSPDFYTSGISGWRLLAYKWGLLDLKQAAKI